MPTIINFQVFRVYKAKWRYDSIESLGTCVTQFLATDPPTRGLLWVEGILSMNVLIYEVLQYLHMYSTADAAGVGSVFFIIRRHQHGESASVDI